MPEEKKTAAQKRAAEAEISQKIRTAALETDGVYGLKRAVKTVLSDAGTVSCDVCPVVEYGVKIPAVAWDIQEHVKETVESDTPYKVVAVNIFVQGVHVPKN